MMKKFRHKILTELIRWLYTKLMLYSRSALRDKDTNQCLTCGAYRGHSVNCPDIDFEEAKSQLKLYYDHWLIKENWVRKRSNMWREQSERWKGKFMELKHENNKLRRNAAKQNGV